MGKNHNILRKCKCCGWCYGNRKDGDWEIEEITFIKLYADFNSREPETGLKLNHSSFERQRKGDTFESPLFEIFPNFHSLSFCLCPNVKSCFTFFKIFICVILTLHSNKNSTIQLGSLNCDMPEQTNSDQKFFLTILIYYFWFKILCTAVYQIFTSSRILIVKILRILKSWTSDQ